MSEDLLNSMDAGQQNQIGAIRDILFGQNMKIYEEEFSRVKKVVSENRAEIENNVRNSNEHIMQTIADLEQRIMLQMQKNHNELMAAIKNLEESKLDRRQMGRLLSDIGSHIAL